MINDILKSSVTVVTIAASVIVAIYWFFVYVMQNNTKVRETFRDLSRDIYSDNKTAQISAAILLRGYLQSRRYKKDALNLFVSLLRVIEPGNLQKTLADSLSYVRNASGQDFQHTMLRGSAIKPKYRIRYEITENSYLLKKKVNFICTDFYQSDLSESSISQINFNKAVFYDCTIKNTTFHNCSFRNASFVCADVENTVFDSCDLDGAIFKNAHHISSAKIRLGNNFSAVSLLQYLDENGVVTESSSESIRYVEKKEAIRIFVSKLGLMDSFQNSRYNQIINDLRKKSNFDIVCINRNEYRSVEQLSMIVDKMRDCSGVVVIAFTYLSVEDGVIHKNVETGFQTIHKANLTSPWIQIETALAYNKKLPCLIISEKSLFRTGILDPKIIGNNDSLFFAEYSDDMSCNADIFDSWKKRVLKYSKHN